MIGAMIGLRAHIELLTRVFPILLLLSVLRSIEVCLYSIICKKLKNFMCQIAVKSFGLMQK